MTFGEKIKEERTKQGWTQTELGKKVGKSLRTVVDWEHGKALPRTRKVYEDLSAVLGVPVSYLLTDDEDFILKAGEEFGYRGKKDAKSVVADVKALLAGGEMDPDDMEEMMYAIQEAYMDAKRRARKFTPKKYAETADGSTQQDD